MNLTFKKSWLHSLIDVCQYNPTPILLRIDAASDTVMLVAAQYDACYYVTVAVPLMALTGDWLISRKALLLRLAEAEGHTLTVTVEAGGDVSVDGHSIQIGGAADYDYYVKDTINWCLAQAVKALPAVPRSASVLYPRSLKLAGMLAKRFRVSAGIGLNYYEVPGTCWGFYAVVLGETGCLMLPPSSLVKPTLPVPVVSKIGVQPSYDERGLPRSSLFSR